MKKLKALLFSIFIIITCAGFKIEKNYYPSVEPNHVHEHLTIRKHIFGPFINRFDQRCEFEAEMDINTQASFELRFYDLNHKWLNSDFNYMYNDNKNFLAYQPKHIYFITEDHQDRTGPFYIELVVKCDDIYEKTIFYIKLDFYSQYSYRINKDQTEFYQSGTSIQIVDGEFCPNNEIISFSNLDMEKISTQKACRISSRDFTVQILDGSSYLPIRAPTPPLLTIAVEGTFISDQYYACDVDYNGWPGIYYKGVYDPFKGSYRFHTENKKYYDPDTGYYNNGRFLQPDYIKTDDVHFLYSDKEKLKNVKYQLSFSNVGSDSCFRYSVYDTLRFSDKMRYEDWNCHIDGEFDNSDYGYYNEIFEVNLWYSFK